MKIILGGNFISLDCLDNKLVYKSDSGNENALPHYSSVEIRVISGGAAIDSWEDPMKLTSFPDIHEIQISLTHLRTTTSKEYR